MNRSSGINFLLFFTSFLSAIRTRKKLAVSIVAAGLLALGGCSDIESSSIDQDQKEIDISDPEKHEDARPSSENQEKEQETPNNGSTDTAGTTGQIPVTLVKTIDGDTIKVIYNGKEVNVRYLLIDTPETNHPRLGKQPFGEEAKERNKQLVNSGDLTLEFDIGERVDKYGRLLAYVYADGKSVQETLLEEGLARVAYIYPPNTRHLTPYEEAQNRAKAKGVGIWSIENYATDSGFKESSSDSAGQSSGEKPAQSQSGGGTEHFQNCTELRKVYPNGVPEGHPAYQPKLDRDKDGYACER